MLYINQNDYAHVPYQHDMANGGAPVERRNVGSSGCGLCCSCMVVEHLTPTTSVWRSACVCPRTTPPTSIAAPA